MHIVSTEASVMIMNCFQNQREIRMQLMQSPANGTPSPEQQRIQKYFSLSLRIWIKPQQPRHLMISRTCLDAKRLSVWTKISWTSSDSNTSRGTASKTCGARRTFNRPQGSSLLYNKINMPFFELSSCTTTPPHCQSQLGKRWCSAAGTLLDDLQFTPLRENARLELFWAEDWSALWAMVRAECDIAPVQNATRRTATQQKQSRVRKVATFARTGEKGRALAAARNAPPVPVTEQIVQEIKSLFPADPEPPAPAQAFVSGLFLSEVAEHIPTTLRKMPRLSEPGPLSLRAGHWYDFGSLAGNSDLFVQVVAHTAAAPVPHSVLQYLKAGQITPLAKPTGGHRPLLMVSFFRRLALKSVMTAEKESRCWKTRQSNPR